MITEMFDCADHVALARYRCAIVIVTYNAVDYIEKCIRSALRYSTDHDIVVVVDNASCDGTRPVLQTLAGDSERIKVVLLDKNIGFGNANNVGFSFVEAEQYFLLNADAWLIADSLAPCINLMRADSSIKICGLPLVFPDGSPQTFAYAFTSWKKWFLQLIGVRKIVLWIMKYDCMKRWLGSTVLGKSFVESQARQRLAYLMDDSAVIIKDYSGSAVEANWICGAAMVLDGGFVRRTGGFDPKIFLYGEDEDICLTARREGGRVVWCDACPVVHVFGWGKSRFNPIVAKMKYDSLSYFIRKNHEGISRLLMSLLLPLHVYGIRFWHAFKK